MREEEKMNNSKIENLTDKPLKDFQPTDTLYICKKIGGFDGHYLCEFVGIEKGLVKAKPISVEPRWWGVPEGFLRARASSCYLYGRGAPDHHAHCIWFKNINDPVEVTAGLSMKAIAEAVTEHPQFVPLSRFEQMKERAERAEEENQRILAEVAQLHCPRKAYDWEGLSTAIDCGECMVCLAKKGEKTNETLS